MNTLEAISKRRSIRRFTAQALSDAQLQTLLKAAMMAPTGRNCQEWEFVVVRDPKTFQQIQHVHPYAQPLATADAAIIVCGNAQRQHADNYWVADCGAATQNILLAATELGLGSVWLGVYPVEERMAALRELLGLPSHILPLNIVALGYPDEEKADVTRFDAAKVHYEKWA